MKKLARLVGVAFFCAIFAPLLFVEAHEPKEVTITQMMNKIRKDAFNSKVDVRRKAFEGFYEYGRNLNHVISSLDYALRSPDPEIRSLAVRAIAEIGPSAKLAVPQLRQMLHKEKDAELRAKAAGALGSIFSEEHPDEENKTVLALARSLREDPSELVRGQACGSLGNIGLAAKDAMGDLIDTMIEKESDAKLRELARGSIFEVAGTGCAASTPRLLELYRKGKIDEPTQITVLRVLGKIAAKEDEVVPLLVGVLKSNDAGKKRLREAAAYGLCAMGPKAKNGLPALVEALEKTLKANDSDSLSLRGKIIHDLPKFGEEAKPAIPALVAALERCLKGDDENSQFLRRQIFDCLGILGSNAIAAAPALRKIAEDLNNTPEIRGRARRSLNAIEHGKKYPR